MAAQAERSGRRYPAELLLSSLRMFSRHHRYFTHLLIRKLQFALRYRWTKRFADSSRTVPAPLVYKLLLTWKCNLHCRMCMLWGDTGWKSSSDSSQEMDWAVIENIFDSLPYNSSFVLTGGEPLLFSRCNELFNKLKENKKFAIICTNGLLLDRYADALKGNPFPTFLISLDGLKEENDAIRGPGVFEKVIKNIQLLKQLPQPPYIGIQFTISPDNVHNMHAFCEKMISLDVDWILLNPTWFLSPEQAESYENYMRNHFNIRPRSHRGYVRPYTLNARIFNEQLAAIRKERWPVQISCYLKEPESMHTFVESPQAILGNDFCYKQWLRIDVLPDGTVAPCIQFPDLAFGSLAHETVMDIWNSPDYRNFRKQICKEPPPVCSKCDNIYLYDARRKYL